MSLLNFSVNHFCLYVIFLLSSVVIFGTNPSFAEELPDGAREQLAEILEHQDFQPRREKLSAWDRMKRVAFARIADKAKEFYNSLRRSDRFKFSESAVASFLRSIADIMGQVADFISAHIRGLMLGGLLLLSLLICHLLLKRKQNFFGFGRKGVTLVEGDPSSKVSLDSVRRLLTSGGLFEALALVRQLQRQSIRTRYSIPDSKTDREVIKFLPIDDQQRQTFEEVSRLFEKHVYAAKQLEESGIQQSIVKALDSLEAKA